MRRKQIAKSATRRLFTNKPLGVDFRLPDFTGQSESDLFDCQKQNDLQLFRVTSRWLCLPYPSPACAYGREIRLTGLYHKINRNMARHLSRFPSVSARAIRAVVPASARLPCIPQSPPPVARPGLWPALFSRRGFASRIRGQPSAFVASSGRSFESLAGSK